MKVVIFNPHHDIWFRNPVRRILKKEVIPSKYALLLDHLIASDARVYFSTRLFFGVGLRGWCRNIFDAFHLLAWAVINRLNLSRVRFVFTPSGLRDKDVVIFMHYGSFTAEDESGAKACRELADCFKDLDIFKIVHMTHYAYCSKIGAANLELLSPDMLVAENDLRKNSPFFMRNFKGVSGEFYHLPFVAALRFQRRVGFSRRTNRLGVTGSITYKMKDTDFLRYFGQDELQPMRRKIYERQAELSSLIDSFIYDLDEARQKESALTSSDDLDVTRAQAAAKQRNYYNADIVEFFNSYRMFAVPEEVCDLPGISFIEGMACGTAYFGLDNPMYRDIGMVPGVHYVAYDGTLEHLLERVAYYQQHADELEQIAEQGYQIAHTTLSSTSVYSKFIASLERMLPRP